MRTVVVMMRLQRSRIAVGRLRYICSARMYVPQTSICHCYAVAEYCIPQDDASGDMGFDEATETLELANLSRQNSQMVFTQVVTSVH